MTCYLLLMNFTIISKKNLLISGEFFRPGRPARPGFSVDAVPAVPASNFFTEIEPSINGGGREEPTQRLFVVYRTTTITTTTGTSYSTLTTYRCQDISRTFLFHNSKLYRGSSLCSVSKFLTHCF